MLFNSYSFIVFFVVVLAVSRLRLPWAVKKSFLLLMSYVFYAAWNPPFVVLLWISTLADWWFAKWMFAAESARKRKLCLIGSLAVNLGMLAYFKYGQFFIDNFVWLANQIGWDFQPAPMSIILPVGISFYTFQTLSYTLDVYRRQARPWHSFLDYALYVTFFPQLVAGPIVRAVDFLPQCEQPKTASAKQLGWGLVLLVVGLFSKVVIADTLMARRVESVFDAEVSLGLLDAWGGTVAFATQILCDFSGYSTCAIGVAMCLGFALPDNFRCPYAAVGFSDFWRRWHITLSSWLRDYLYIPMGGSRCSKVKVYRNLAATMLLGGLWHGASWTFVVWGGLHGLYLVIERLLRKHAPRWRVWSTGPMQIVLMLLTFACVCVAWVFFRADGFEKAWGIITAMFGFNGMGQTIPTIAFAAAGGLLLTHYLMRNTTLEAVAAKTPWWIQSVVLAVMMSLIMISLAGEDRAFIYFQF